jgi:hypothetical protein
MVSSRSIPPEIGALCVLGITATGLAAPNPAHDRALSEAVLPATPSWTAQSNHIGAYFGWSAATAGDVNGDGFSDLIVGAPGYDNGQPAQGRAFLYLGSAQGLSTTPAWTAESNQTFAEFGNSVAAAGDVNRDGYDDVVIGAPGYTNGQSMEGAAFLYLGSAQGLASSPAWIAESNQAQSGFGGVVASAGDINGDGCADVVVGAPYYSHGETNEGRVFVYRGSAQGLSATPSWTAESNQAVAYFGYAVGTAGDVNGDGYADLIVGAWEYDNGQGDEGRAFLYLGSQYGLASTAAWTAESNQASAFFGAAVAAAGDVNRDGYGDVIVGAPGYDNGQDREGEALVYLGSAQGLGAVPSWHLESDIAAAAFGSNVATAGDLNGDGLADIVITAPDFTNGEAEEGKVFVFLSNWLGQQPTAPDWDVEINQAFGGLNAVGTAGDVNGDGFSDLVFGAGGYDNGEEDEGEVFVYHGSALPPGTSFSYSYGSFQADAWFGISVASAGDVDGDGFSDAIAGAPNYDNGETDEGRVYVLTGDDAHVYTLECNQAGAQLGSSVAGAGDVNGDGYSDVIAGAPYYTNGQTSEGRAFLYLGSASGTSTSPAWTAESNQNFAGFGGSVASAGDVNGDGFDDVLVGASGYSNGESREGRAYLYLGSATGLHTTPAWTAESNQDNSGFGISVASAGDVNGDGFSDVLVGADLYDNGQGNEGRVFIYYGTPSGLPTSPSATVESNQADSEFGISVAGAGDVNGDGFSDVIIGADAYDQAHFDEGRVYVYFGSAGGLVTGSPWFADGGENYKQLGYSVAGAGDVNADGYSDIVVGFPFYHAGDGGAALWYGKPGTLASQPDWSVSPDQLGSAFGSSVAGAGDVTGDGFADVLIAAPYYDDPNATNGGHYFIYFGNQRRSDFPGHLVRQAHVASSAPIWVGENSDYQNAFKIKASGISPAGRCRVWLEWEVKPYGAPFNGQNLASGSKLDTGIPVSGNGSRINLTETVLGLTGGGRYCWRARIASNSPFFPRSPWFWLPGNAATELDVRTTGSVIGVTDPAAPVAPASVLEPIHPNPFHSPAEITYTLSTAGPIRLALYDVQGRMLALLDLGPKQAGRHVVQWEGPVGPGGLRAGVYFVRLAFADRITSQKVVVVP